jgi:hypothetical protein
MGDWFFELEREQEQEQEHEQEGEPDRSDANEGLDRLFLTSVESATPVVRFAIHCRSIDQEAPCWLHLSASTTRCSADRSI